MYLQYFETELIELRKELDYHPDLVAILVLQPNTDIYVHIAEIALYCKIVLDGSYTKEAILKLCEIMRKHLKEKRTIQLHSIH